jgi:hypothetical protein
MFVMEVIVRLQVRALCASITCITDIMPSPKGWSRRPCGDLRALAGDLDRQNKLTHRGAALEYPVGFFGLFQWED